MIYMNKDVTGPWIAGILGKVWTPENSSTIASLSSKGDHVATVWYLDYTKASIQCHIAIQGYVGKEFWNLAFSYPFNQLKVKKIIVCISSANVKMDSLAKKLGFKEEGRVSDCYPKGEGMVIFTMDRENCRFLGEHNGKR